MTAHLQWLFFRALCVIRGHRRRPFGASCCFCDKSLVPAMKLRRAGPAI